MSRSRLNRRSPIDLLVMRRRKTRTSMEMSSFVLDAMKTITIREQLETETRMKPLHSVRPSHVHAVSLAYTLFSRF